MQLKFKKLELKVATTPETVNKLIACDISKHIHFVTPFQE